MEQPARFFQIAPLDNGNSAVMSFVYTTHGEFRDEKLNSPSRRLGGNRIAKHALVK